jgi:pimeloyl-ACP methyl ester carboxylesterase
VGASLGGMIAQNLAIRHPRRVRSLASIMSSPGGRRFMLARLSAMRALALPAPRSAEQAGERLVRVFGVIGSRGFAVDEARLRAVGELMYRRCPDARGVARQYAAIAASGSRRKALRGLRVPAVVIHGSDDPLILPRAARATARAIPGARLRIVEGMGHDLPRAVWPLLVEEIEAVAARARTARAWAAAAPISRSA